MLNYNFDVIWFCEAFSYIVCGTHCSEMNYFMLARNKTLLAIRSVLLFFVEACKIM